MTVEKNKPIMKKAPASKLKNKDSVPAAVTVRNRYAEEEERVRFLNLRRLPARLSVQQAAWVVGVRPHSIQILVSYRLLKPIGTPARNEAKFFATAYVLRLAEDNGWQDLSTAILQEYWKLKNQRRSKIVNRIGSEPGEGRTANPRSS
jgi:hypothetical protein